MGQDHSTSKSSRRGAAQQKPAESTPKDTASIPAPAPTTSDSSKPAAKKTPVPEPVDIVITATASDSALVTVLKNKIEAEKYTVYSNTSTTEDAAKEVGRMLVDAKLLIFMASEESVTNNKCGDQVSLAYISNKPILVAARKQKEELTKKLNFGLKLTLEQLHWTYFESNQPDDDLLNTFIGHVHQYQNPVTETVEAQIEPSLEAPAPTQQRRIRMNTKLRTQTGTDTTQAETVTETFWERNFGGDTDKVKWFRFQQCFISDYDTQLKSLFTDEHMPWLLEEVLHISIFGGADEISKEHFMQVRGDSAEKHGFWRTVRQIAVEKFNMKEVFNMQSTVRLTAVENLGKFQNPAVIEALLRLLEDPDPNIRAVAAISMGHTGIQEDFIIDRLIGLLKDSDRIVRQSACLTLGTMKAKKAIPHISNVWRNDFISVVRDAARTALEKMEVPEAQEVLKVTRVLEAEIKHLEGKIVQV